MIPKIIHYCWFGGGEKDELTKKCIESWKRICPDFEIKEWNESNYDVTKNRYMYDAFQERRWGFVSDYARLDIVNQHGGIYLDTDVEMLKPLNDLLDNIAFFGFEDSASEYAINTGGGFGAEANNPFVEGLLHTYDHISFIWPDGTFNLTPCPALNSKYFIEHGFLMDNSYQLIDGVAVYPSEFFSPINYEKKRGKITGRSYSVHYYNASWVSPEEKKRIRRAKRIDYVKHLPNMAVKKLFGKEKYERLKKKIKG